MYSKYHHEKKIKRVKTSSILKATTPTTCVHKIQQQKNYHDFFIVATVLPLQKRRKTTFDDEYKKVRLLSAF